MVDDSWRLIECALRKELSAEEFAEAWNEGQALTIEQALVYAWEENP